MGGIEVFRATSGGKNKKGAQAASASLRCSCKASNRPTFKLSTLSIPASHHATGMKQSGCSCKAAMSRTRAVGYWDAVRFGE